MAQDSTQGFVFSVIEFVIHLYDTFLYIVLQCELDGSQKTREEVDNAVNKITSFPMDGATASAGCSQLR
jgi:hypothetical protein